jgi:hypothetical protein
MSRFVGVFLAVLLVSLPAWAVEVLVLASAPVQVDAGASSYRRGFELQNLGPNDIFCELGGATPVVNKSRKVPASGGTWGIGAGKNQIIKCIAATADQATTAATIYTEVL